MEVYFDAGYWALLAGSFILASTHTVSPDHWFPFVMVGRARNWKTSRILGLALLAGTGHVGTSVVIGLTGVFAEKGSSREVALFLENATPVLLMIFGFLYTLWAWYRHRIKKYGHIHGISFLNKLLGIDPHDYCMDSESSHDHDNRQVDLTGKNAGWGLVLILGLTPCIALLPLTFAAARYGTVIVILVNVIFAVTTLLAILIATWLGCKGFSLLKLKFFEKYGDYIAGVIIFLAGFAVKLLDL